jgi:hypothetical protein
MSEAVTGRDRLSPRLGSAPQFWVAPVAGVWGCARRPVRCRVGFEGSIRALLCFPKPPLPGSPVREGVVNCRTACGDVSAPRPHGQGRRNRCRNRLVGHHHGSAQKLDGLTAKQWTSAPWPVPSWRPPHVSASLDRRVGRSKSQSLGRRRQPNRRAAYRSGPVSRAGERIRQGHTSVRSRPRLQAYAGECPRAGAAWGQKLGGGARQRCPGWSRKSGTGTAFVGVRRRACRVHR